MRALRSISTVLSTVMILSVSAYADRHDNDRGGRYVPVQHYSHDNRGNYHDNRGNYHHSGGNWVIPLVIGGMLGYVLSEPNRENVTYVQSVSTPAPVIYTPQPVYEERWVYFSDCDCQRKVLVPVR